MPTRLDAAIAAAEEDSTWVHRPTHEEEGLTGPAGKWKDLTREERLALMGHPAPYRLEPRYHDEVEADVRAALEEISSRSRETQPDEEERP